MIDPPPDGAPEQAPRWDRTGTEGCGGGIRVFLLPRCFQGTWIYIGGRRASGEPEGAHEGGDVPAPLGAPWTLVAASLVPSRVLQVFCEDAVPKITLPKVSFRLDSV